MAEISELSLYHLDNELLNLLAYRDERLSDSDAPPTDEEISAVDGEIRKYLEALPAKVSGVAAIFRMWRGQVATIKTEADRLAGLRRSIETREAWLKEIVAGVLDHQPEPKKGCKKLIGSDGSQLMLKGNGGVQPLEITAELVPDEYQVVTVRMASEKWDNICDLIIAAVGVERYREFITTEAEVLAKEPSNARIREALAQDCARCGGNGIVDSYEHGGVEYEAENPCKECGGSGKAGVPGCRLLARGEHVEIR